MAEDYCNYLWACSGLYITINLSAQDLENPSFGDYVRELLANYGVPTTLIVFEVTENALVDRVKASKQLQALREQGHRIAVDDFGTGYSSLSYVNELPLDILKIDRSFLDLKKMLTDDALWRHVAQMAHALNLTVIAEGVEHPAQAEELSRAGVQFAQGWLYSKDFAAATLARHFFRLRS
ncbi:putative membrane protein YjcC [compost metagenome]